MTSDPKKFVEIARVCATLSRSAATSEERDTFADLATGGKSLPLTQGRVSGPSMNAPIPRRTIDTARRTRRHE